MPIHQISPIQRVHYPLAESLNPTLEAAFKRLDDKDFDRRTHFIGGRFENLYPAPDRLPGIDALLDFVELQARAVLGAEAPPLRLGYWLNATAPGQSTSEHSHDEHDELLSGVYFVVTPPGSGDLLFYDDPFEIRVPPEAGMLLLFPPRLPHAVDENRSEGLRLSIAFNIGPAI
jgi:ectoine hydroxylase-related dioxygenase (phytanoyl-CoA dioxygenase family)